MLLLLLGLTFLAAVGGALAVADRIDRWADRAAPPPRLHLPRWHRHRWGT